MYKSIVRKGVYRFVRAWFLKKGYHPYAANLLSTCLAEELVDNSDHLSKRTRFWAWKHGFLAERVAFYGLTEENVTNYLSDFEYYKLYPLNKSFSFLIDDKVTLKYTLGKYDSFLPVYYFLIDQKGEACWLDEKTKTDSKYIIENFLPLLRCKGSLALKPYSDSSGSGFYKVCYKGENYYLSGNTISAKDLISFLKSLRGYICTEFVQQADVFERIYPGVAHTIRIQTAKHQYANPKCIFSFLRIGRIGQNDCVTHSTSGVTAAVDICTGLIVRAFYVDSSGRYVDTKKHPDTGEALSIVIPGWREIICKCLEIHKYLGVLDYLGFDVIVTNSGFKICEINSFSSIRASQRAFPFWNEPGCREYFSSCLKHVK